MPAVGKKILIIDEDRFCRICSALLEAAGYGIETFLHPLTNSEKLLSQLDKNIGLIITNFPLDNLLLKEIKKRKIPSLILSDNIDRRLIRILDNLHSSYCMIKPIDYEKFRSMVQIVMSGNFIAQEGFLIV
jgi:hypothetical protein